MWNSNKLTAIRNISSRLDFLFPQQEVLVRKQFGPHQLVIWGVVFVLTYILASFIPPDGFVGFDWTHFFSQVRIPDFYPPWTSAVVSLLNWPSLIAITLTSVLLASYLRATHKLSLIACLTTLPFFWTLFLGQIDGLVVLGLLGLPILSPLALLKPQIAIFGFGARRSYLIGLVITLLLSFALWGFWPAEMFSVWTIHEEGRYVNDIAIGLIGIPISLILMWFSRGDVDMLMLAGAFMTPYLLPYNLIAVVPALARLTPKRAAVGSLLSWLPFSANFLGPMGWGLGWLFVLWVWVTLAIQRYPNAKIIGSN
jgi:hypothetical protein